MLDGVTIPESVELALELGYKQKLEGRGGEGKRKFSKAESMWSNARKGTEPEEIRESHELLEIS